VRVLRKGVIEMRKSGLFITLVLASVLCPNAWQARRYTGWLGDIAATDLTYNTVVLEVLIAGGRFTVGEPLSPKATV